MLGGTGELAWCENGPKPVCVQLTLFWGRFEIIINKCLSVMFICCVLVLHSAPKVGSSSTSYRSCFLLLLLFFFFFSLIFYYYFFFFIFLFFIFIYFFIFYFFLLFILHIHMFNL
jgi:hypothetical protein